MRRARSGTAIPALLLLGSAAFAGCAGPLDPGGREARALDACSAWISCASGWPDHAIGFCLESIAEGRRTTSVVPSTAAEVECIVAAHGDCHAIRACVGLSIAPSETCVERCDGDVIVSCHEGQEIRTDCARTAPGNACVETTLDPAVGGGVARGCRSTICTESSCCDGNRWIDCGGSPSAWCTVEPCAAEGTRCGLYEMFGATYRGCVGEGEPCVEGTCEDTIARPCVHGRFAAPLDCAATGEVCEIGVCTPPPTTAFCTQPSRLQCDGDRLAHCDAGATVRVDCVELGFAGCEPLTSGGFTTARCAPRTDDAAP